MRDLFDDEPRPGPRPAAKKAPTTPEPPVRDRMAEAAAEGLEQELRAIRAQPCEFPLHHRLGNRCVVGGGDATISRDGGQTWVCGVHAEPGWSAKYPRRPKNA